MSALTRAARGQGCTVWLPGCQFDRAETVVLAHLRLPGFCGVGQKPADWLAAHCCASCHDICDGRRHIDGMTRTEIQLAHAVGVFRTLARLAETGRIKIG